jgi:molecular chaperone GrpE (heat shock protein)
MSSSSSSALSFLRKGGESEMAMARWMDGKADSVYSLLQITGKLDRIEKEKEEREEEIKGVKETMRQLIGGLYCQRTQGEVIELHLAVMNGDSERGICEREEIEEEKIWPTTRQGDKNEKKIAELEAKNAALEKRLSDLEEIINRILG